MSHLHLWDKREKTLHLCRDRYGEKPLYYYLCEGALYFASELKAIHKLHENKLRINHSSAVFLQTGWLTDHNSIYEEMNKVQAGTILSFQKGSSKPLIDQYWSIQETIEVSTKFPFKGSMLEAQNKLDELLDATIKKEMISDVPIGCALSGGIDLSLVSYYMQNNSINRIQTFIRFESDEYNEANYAKEIANLINSDHHEIYLTDKDIVKSIEKIINIYDEPFADASQVPIPYK